MNKPNIFRRIGMRVLLWILADEQQSRTCELNRVLYQRSADGRSLSRFSHPQVEVGERTHGLKRERFIAYHPDDRVQIGKYCSIDGVRFIFGEHGTDRVTTFPLRAICFNEAPHADALSKGDIVVGNDVWVGAGGIVDTVRHEQTGLLAGVGSSAELRACIMKLLNDQPLWSSCSREGVRVATTEFTLELNARRYVGLYEALLGNPNRLARSSNSRPYFEPRATRGSF